MSKYIKREHVLAEIDYAAGLPCGSPIAAYEIAKAIIEDAPTIDAVEVVRCKDCKHYHVETYLLYGDYETLEWCDLLNIRGKIPPDPKPMDFCSYGERKETDHE